MYDQTNNGEFTQDDRENIAQETEASAQDAGANGGPGAAEAVDDVAVLKEELQQAQAKSNEYLDGWQRARADFANYKRRIERDQAQLSQTITGNILKRYLEVLDDLDRALRNRPQGGEDARWTEGIELIYRKLLALLESEGVSVMNVEGQIFDPNLHEAISQEESPDHQSGEVIEVVKNGYMLGDRVLRPALVRVAR